jgi:hypothetical protein
MACYTGCPKIGVQTAYYFIEDVNVHEKYMEKMFPIKKSFFFFVERKDLY